MQPVGVIFKGSGFYVTDHRGKSSTGIPSPGKKKEEEAKAGSTASESTSSSGSPATAGKTSSENS